jgi:5-formyltetrahydrofolate cyclo-ligase
MDKKEIRKIIKNKRNLLTRQQVIKQSSQISKNLIKNLLVNIPDLQNKVIGLYLSSNNEVDTTFLMHYFISDLKNNNICIPKINIKDYSMQFKRYKIGDNLCRHHKYTNILEPEENTETLDPEIIFIPLVACDKFGNRIGMGGGFYDRKIHKIKQNNQNITLIGLSYDFQLVESIKKENTDQSLDFIGLQGNILSYK